MPSYGDHSENRYGNFPKYLSTRDRRSQAQSLPPRRFVLRSPVLIKMDHWRPKNIPQAETSPRGGPLPALTFAYGPRGLAMSRINETSWVVSAALHGCETDLFGTGLGAELGG